MKKTAMKPTETPIQLKRYTPIILTICIGIILAVISFYYVRYQELQIIKTEFNMDAQNRINTIKREIDANFAVIQSLQSLYMASQEVTRAEFLEFSKSPLKLHYDIQAMEWTPKISHSERERYEQEARIDGFPGFQITERNINGEIIRAGERKEYFPVYFVEPYKSNETVHGYDLASDATLLEALNKSRNTGEMVATAPITLIQESREHNGFLVFIPIYQKDQYLDTAKKRRENLLGFVLGVFNINDFIDQALSYLEPVGIDLQIYDESGHGEATFLYSHFSRIRSNEKHPVNQKGKYNSIVSLPQTVNIADRKWKIVAYTTPQYVAHAEDWHAWAVSMSVLLITGFIATYLKSTLTRTVYIEILLEKITVESDDRRKLADKLLESEARYHSLISNIPSVTWITDNKGESTFISPNIEKIYGYTADEIYNNGESLWFGRIHPDDIEKVKDAYGKLFTEEGYFDIQYRIQRKDGEWIWLHDRAMTTYKKEGIRFAYGVFSDITERKKSEDALESLATTFSAISGKDFFDQVSIHLASVLDMDYVLIGELVGNNDKVKVVSGAGKGQLLDPFEYDLADTPCANVMGQSSCHYPQGVSDQFPKDLLLAEMGIEGYLGSPLFDKSGKPLGIMVILDSKPVTNPEIIHSMLKIFVGRVSAEMERQKAEEKIREYSETLEQKVKERTQELEDRTENLNKSEKALRYLLEDVNEIRADLAIANAKLEELDHLKSMFIASMSHELRTPLNSIIGFTGIILQGMAGDINEEQKDHLERVYRSGQHLLDLITDIIDISKIEAGKMESRVEAFQLDLLIHDAIDSLKPQIDKKGLEIYIAVPPDIQINSDRKRLLQCILNFLSNAVKFTERGEIVVTVNENNGMIKIKVKDTGIGMKDEDMKKLFGSFVRLNSHLKTIAPGTGLGLYLTKKIASEILGGTVYAESIWGTGSTFTIEVPKIL